MWTLFLTLFVALWYIYYLDVILCLAKLKNVISYEWVVLSYSLIRCLQVSRREKHLFIITWLEKIKAQWVKWQKTQFCTNLIFDIQPFTLTLLDCSPWIGTIHMLLKMVPFSINCQFTSASLWLKFCKWFSCCCNLALFFLLSLVIPTIACSKIALFGQLLHPHQFVNSLAHCLMGIIVGWCCAVTIGFRYETLGYTCTQSDG